MSQEINSLKNLYRRKNLIIYNIKEEKQETCRELEGKIINFFYNMKITVDLNQIDTVRRIGFRTKWTRPILVRFVAERVKFIVFGEVKELRGSNISISNDFPPKIRTIRKEATPFINDARIADLEAKLRYDKLSINGKLFTLAELKSAKEAFTQEPLLEEESSKAALAVQSSKNPAK